MEVDEGVHGASLIPQPLEVPPVCPAIVVQVAHRTPSGLHAPVLPVPAVLPPSAFDPPSSDDVRDLVAPTPPGERCRHPGIPLHRHLFVVSLGHEGGLLAIERMFERTMKVLLTGLSCQGRIRGFPVAPNALLDC